MERTVVEKFIEDEFQFLETEFGFCQTLKRRTNGVVDFEYVNSTTGVHIVYEISEAYLFITLYRLVQGRLVRNPFRIGAGTRLNGYSLDDIILSKDPSCMVKPAYEYGRHSEFYLSKDGFRRYVRLFATNLRRFGGKILTGDFADFKKADDIVKARVKDLQR